MGQLFADAARAYLSTGIAAGDTTISIAAGGALFPVANGTDWFKAVLQDANGIEIVYVTAHTSASTSFTVTRGQEGTTARSFAAGSVFGLRVTAADTAAFAGKVDKVAGKGLSTEDYTAAEKTKLAGIAAGATAYSHPANHPASIITQDASNRFVTDAEKDAWNAKQDLLVSGTNLKTINSTSLLGTGDVVIGGLQQLTEFRSTSSPNDVVPVHGVIAAGAESNIDLSMSPKGSGAFLLASSDGTAVGGAKRGEYAVDLQTFRYSANEVASGKSSAAIGSRNKASNKEAIAIGISNTVSGACSVALGATNTVTGTYSYAIGSNHAVSGYSSLSIGSTNTTSGAGSIAIGSFNTSSGEYSVCLGRNTDANGVGLRLCIGGNPPNGARGGAQTSIINLSGGTYSASPVNLVTSSDAGDAGRMLVLQNNSSFMVCGYIVGHDVTSASVGYEVKFLIRRGANASTTALVGTPTVNRLFYSGSLNSTTITVTADTTFGAVRVMATGLAATEIHWNCTLYSTEVI